LTTHCSSFSLCGIFLRLAHRRLSTILLHTGHDRCTRCAT
jgi:hypothetical protein